MRPEFYREQWQQLQAAASAATGEAQAEQVESLAARVANSFIDRYFYSDEYNADYIQLLCEMATAFDDDALNNIAAQALFGIIIERLCDDFEELQTETYNRLISQVIGFLRQLPEGAELHAQLNDFDLGSEQALFRRIESIRLQPDQPVPADATPEKILILSRVTIGADIAITSVISQRVASRFPNAEIVIIGNHKLRQIYAADSGMRVRELSYIRRGGLLERFAAWLALLDTVRDEVGDLPDEKFLLFDPDSRLTQLGVLPLVNDSQYRFFNSRGKPEYPPMASVSELANLWLDAILQTSDSHHPAVWPPQAERELAGQLLEPTRASGRHIITLNLGVGGNERKRVGDEFEQELILHLLQEKGREQDPDNLILLDLGFGTTERQRNEQIITAVEQAGFVAHTCKFADLNAIPNSQSSNIRLLGVECSVAEVAALIAHSQEFIGYDSACQHLAAALGIPTFTLFAGTTNPKFVRRWHACGPNRSEILFVDTITRNAPIDNTEIIARLHDLRCSG
ncbi:MAG: glycosyltransferase family 9 protein [Pseudohongiellaceae bacterium]